MSSRDPTLCVRVTNLSKLLKESHLRQLFECCGPVASCVLTTEQGSRVCLVEYHELAHAKAASFLNGTPLGDLNLHVVLLSDYLAAKAPPLPAAALPPPLPSSAHGIPGMPPALPGMVPGLLPGMMPLLGGALGVIPPLPPPPPPPLPGAAAVAAAGAAVPTPTPTPTPTGSMPPLSATGGLPLFSQMLAAGTVPPALLAAGINPIQAAANAALAERAAAVSAVSAASSAAAVPALALPAAAAAAAAMPAAPPPLLTGSAAALAMAAADPNNQVSAAARARMDEVARTIYVGNIAHNLTEDHLRTFFSPIGPIAYCKLAGEMNGVRYGFVEYEKLEHANLALGLSGRVLGDRALKVGKAHNPIIKTDKGHADNAAFVAAHRPGPTHDKAEAAKRAMEALKKLTNKVAGTGTGTTDDGKPDRKSSRSRSPGARAGNGNGNGNGKDAASSTNGNGSSSRRRSSRSRSPRRHRSPSPRGSGGGGGHYRSSRYGYDARDVRDSRGGGGRDARDYITSTGGHAHRSGWRDYRSGGGDADRDRRDRSDRSDRERERDRDRERERDRDRERDAKASRSSGSGSGSGSSNSKAAPADTTGKTWDGFQWNAAPGSATAANGAPLSAAQHEKMVKAAQYDAERERERDHRSDRGDRSDRSERERDRERSARHSDKDKPATHNG